MIDYNPIYTVVSLTLVGIAALNLIVLIASLRRYRRSDVMQCGGCGYDVAGLQELRCPECGGLLRRLGIPAPPLQRGFSTAFICVLVSLVAAVTLLGAFNISSTLLNTRWPRRANIQDSYSSLRVNQQFIPPSIEGHRIVQICADRGPVLMGGGPLSDSMYPGLSDYKGAIVVFREMPTTGVYQTNGSYTRDDDITNPLKHAENFQMANQVGEVLIVKDVHALSEADVEEWVDSLNLEWVEPKNQQYGYEEDKTPNEYFAHVIFDNVKSVVLSGSTRSTSPFSGGTTGSSVRRNLPVYIEREPWVMQVYLATFGGVCVVVYGLIFWWVLRRRKKTKAIPN